MSSFCNQTLPLDSSSIESIVDANNNFKRRVSNPETRALVNLFAFRPKRCIMKKINNRRYRSGSSSDSAITLDNVFEDDDEPILQSHLDVLDDFQQTIFNFVCLALTERTVKNSSNSERILEIVKRYYETTGSDNQPTDRFGFLLDSAAREQRDRVQELYLRNVLNELLNARATKFWYNFSGCENLKSLVREYGVPNEMRPQLWLSFFRAKIGDHFDICQLLCAAQATAASELTMDATVRQIDLDVYRTMPQHQMFDDSVGIEKLRRVLIAYGVHANPVVGYCQAMNFIAALLLVVFEGSEEHALLGLICIVEHYFPAHYMDQHLTGARADQLLLKDLLLTRMQRESSKLSGQVLDEITNSLTLNWFLSLFHNALPWQTRLGLLDCFMLEGVKVLFRFSIALVEMEKESLAGILRCPYNTATGETINLIRMRAKSCYDIVELKRTAFGQIKIPRRKHLATRRAFYVRQLNSLAFCEANATSEESTAQWIRRRSSEFLGLSQPLQTRKPLKVVVSRKHSQIACCKADHSSINNSKDLVEIFSSDANTSAVVTVRRPSRSASLVGVSDCGTRLVFTQYASKAQTSRTLDERSGVETHMASVPFDLVEAFYLEESEQLLAVGKTGVLSKMMLDSSGACGRLSDSQASETINLGKRSQVLAAALDSTAGLLCVHFVGSPHSADALASSSSEQLFVVDTFSLDVYNCIDLGAESICRVVPSSGLVFVARQRPDGNTAISLSTPNFSRQLLSENEGALVDAKAFPSLDADGNDNHRTLLETSIVVALFTSGRIICFEMSGYCLKCVRRSSSVSSDIAESALVVDATKNSEGVFHVTLVHPLCVNKVSVVKV